RKRVVTLWPALTTCCGWHDSNSRRKTDARANVRKRLSTLADSHRDTAKTDNVSPDRIQSGSPNTQNSGHPTHNSSPPPNPPVVQQPANQSCCGFGCSWLGRVQPRGQSAEHRYWLAYNHAARHVTGRYGGRFRQI